MRSRIRSILAFAIMLITGCRRPSVGASTNLDAAQLLPLLKSVEPLIAKGFKEEQVGTVKAAFTSMPVGEYKVLTFPVVFHGKQVSLEVQMKKGDLDSVDIWFLSDPDLEAEILKVMKAMQQ
jgi:hypothetical protein